MLVLSRKPKESIQIGPDINVEILGIRGDKVRLGIEAPADVAVHRDEVYRKIQETSIDLDDPLKP